MTGGRPRVAAEAYRSHNRDAFFRMLMRVELRAPVDEPDILHVDGPFFYSPKFRYIFIS